MIKLIKELIKLINESGIDELEVKTFFRSIRVAKKRLIEPQAVSLPKEILAPQEKPKEEEKGTYIKAPMVGTFYRASSPGNPPYVEVGDEVTPGKTVCVIEAMKVMNEIESDVKGVIQEILVNNGDPVEYGQPLFRVEPK
jgi:acetyl-CoA carboxylase biotin carboxyl carrier protein